MSESENVLLEEAKRSRDAICKCYEFYRGQLEHEDNLLSQRITWIVTSQAFLLGTYVFLVNSPSLFFENGSHEGASGEFMATIKMLRGVFPAVGFLSSIAVFLSAVAAMRAIADLIAAYNCSILGLISERTSEMSDDFIHTIVRKIHQKCGMPAFISHPVNRSLGLLAGAFFGPIFSIAWLLLAAASLRPASSNILYAIGGFLLLLVIIIIATIDRTLNRVNAVASPLWEKKKRS